MHIGHGLGLVALLGLIAFAFGERAAKIAAAIMLICGAGLFLYVAWLVVSGSI